jgi:hypothetical protein
MERLGASCTQLNTVAKDEAIWRPLIKRTFGEAAAVLHPPEPELDNDKLNESVGDQKEQ